MSPQPESDFRDQRDRFTLMYETALPVVYGFLLARVGGDRALAEDLTAETFTAAVAEFRIGRQDFVTTSWLRTVAKRRLIDHWRRQSVARAKLVAIGRPTTDPVPDLAERAGVIQVLGALPKDQQIVLVLHHIEGYPVTEIAAIIDRTPKATESLLARAREAFRSNYAEEVDHG